MKTPDGEVSFKIDSNPDFFGEVLRDYCFVPENDGDFGCYSTFKLKEEFGPLPNHIKADFIVKILKSKQFWGEEYFYQTEFAEEAFDGFWNNAYTNGNITLAWWWDGDGALAIGYSGKMAVNSDCKKDYGWEWVDEQ